MVLNGAKSVLNGAILVLSPILADLAGFGGFRTNLAPLASHVV